MSGTKYKIPCRDCGVIVERSNNLKTTRCFKCSTEKNRKNNREHYQNKISGGNAKKQ